MKPHLLQLILIVTLLLLSCGSKPAKDISQDNAKLNEMIAELNGKFLKSNAFQSIMFSFDQSMGNTILVKVTENPDSAKVQEWFYINNQWELTSETKLEPDSLKVPDHFFSIDVDYQISKLTDLFATASDKLQNEKKIKAFEFKSINLLMGNQPVVKDKMENLITQITVEAIAEKKSYYINFDRQGSFVSINE